MTAAVVAVLAAWTEPGPRPDIHEVAKARLRAEWPALASALDQLEHSGANVSRETFAHVDPLKLQLGQIVEAYAWPVAPGDAPVARGTFVAVVDGETMLDSAVAILDDPAADNPHAQTRVRIDRHEFRIVKAGA